MTEQNLSRNANKFHKDTFDKTTEARRQKVLEAAIEEFSVKGYNATSINDISRKSNISIGSLYSYFASKEDLFLTIVNSAIDIMEAILNDILEKSSDIFDSVERLVSAAREFAQKYQKLNRIYLDITTQGLSQLSVRLSDKLEIKTPQLLSLLIRQAKEKGMINNEIDERVMAYCIDNLLMMYQFSFSSDYYKERLKIYLGETTAEDIDNIEKSIVNFIRSAIQIYS